MNDNDRFENQTSGEETDLLPEDERTRHSGSGSMMDQATQTFGGGTGGSGAAGGWGDRAREGIGGFTGGDSGDSGDSGGGLLDKAKGFLGGLSGGDATGNSDGSGEGAASRSTTERDEKTW